jgi:hypothetical protein
MSELLAVMHGDGVPDELRQDSGTPRPRAHHFLLVRRVHHVDFLFQMAVGERPFL